MTVATFNESDVGFWPAWHRWYPHNGTPESAFTRYCFLVRVPVPWRVDGRWVRRTLRATLSNVRRPDDTIHNHPASAIRIILRNGYREEVILPDGSTYERDWLPGMVGYIPPTMFHRIVKVYGDGSLTLWLRGVVVGDVKYLASSSVERDVVIKVASHPRRARTY